MGWACFECAATGRTEHAPTSADYPDSVLRRTCFIAGGGHGWKISALETPRAKPAPWKIVVITGAPSWAEYWAETLAELPQDREMIVVDRPGYAGSEPLHPVPDIRVQAEALAPVLKAAPGQKVLLVGQSYGAAIAAILAAENPGRVASLVLLSGFFGEAGPTTRWLPAPSGAPPPGPPPGGAPPASIFAQRVRCSPGKALTPCRSAPWPRRSGPARCCAPIPGSRAARARRARTARTRRRRRTGR